MPKHAAAARPRLSAHLVIAGVAAGATISAFQFGTQVPDVHAGVQPAATRSGLGGDNTAPTLLLTGAPAHDEVEQLRKSMLLADRKEVEAQARRKAEYEAEQVRKTKVVAPTVGTITSNYGPRWGTTHYGLDIANRIGTPVVSTMDGVVLEAGPAGGFGLWVRVRHTDGTTAIYGHINSYAVREGQQVTAGQVIAQMGNRGISTGSHLHFELWDQAGRKLDPLAWLRSKGVRMERSVERLDTGTP
ncbi:M23 family metallopeptidase [Lentzea nigeriaca]|uniref:M23 family metallopeptidase n=1 Tax=Lentzea nigeriaca TaxID=1128665 RepID=UPI0027DCA0A9|nr:M23 family metallopeptidase [Lentzea nigeriaca]MBM7860695.1 murein DD-endopeptidase MepM/ murein hydrolase activator NlpD [Lentzea nigeriaca]